MVRRGTKKAAVETTAQSTVARGKEEPNAVTVTSGTVLVDSVCLSTGTLVLEEGGRAFLSATVCPANASNTSVSWSSSNPRVAEVNPYGRVIAKKIGSAVICAASADGSQKQAYCNITVVKPIAVSGIEVYPTNLDMIVEDTKYLCTTIVPNNATNQLVTWCSSDENVATVGISSGKITAKKAGSAVITAATRDGHTANCTVNVKFDTVTIKEDGDFNKVVFNKSGKVWRCINHDMIFDEKNTNNTVLIQRSNHNFFTCYDQNDLSISNATPKKYNDEEIKLLYAIDPYGVAHYIQRYVDQLDITVEDKVKYKDKIFTMLFNREPRYFAKTKGGIWYEVDEYEDINDAVSESEVYFGIRPLYDWYTSLETLGACRLILNKVFSTKFFTSPFAKVIVSKTVKTGLLIASGMESVLRKEFGSYVEGDTFEKAVEKTSLDWVLRLVSLYDSLEDVTDSMNLDSSYNKEIIEHCACHIGYNVFLQLKNGTTYNLNKVCEMLDSLKRK